MSRLQVFTGDEAGNIKCIRVSPGQVKFESQTLENKNSSTQRNRIEKLFATGLQDKTLLLAARSNGSVSALSENSDGAFAVVKQWEEAHEGKAYVGLSSNQHSIYTCTSHGSLRMYNLHATEEPSSPKNHKTTLPARLQAWELTSDGSHFAYGGKEVELSVWNTQQAFESKTSLTNEAQTPGKRKRGSDLLPGEIWRAKSVSNDNLDLRRPVDITALSHLYTGGSSQTHLVVGMASGDLRRYDTRSARKPVADWKAIDRMKAIKVVQSGRNEHEVMIADNGTNLAAIDTRTGGKLYSYQSISGTITSVAPCHGSLMVSASRDRFLRLHSVVPPGEQGKPLDNKGEVLGSLFLHSTPTTVVCDPHFQDQVSHNAENSDEDDDIWNDLQDVNDSEPEESGEKRKRSRST